VKPQIFETALSAVQARFIGLDGRAPIVVAGDAAQTGHVFSGQTAFVNIALALRLCEELVNAKRAISERKVNDPAIARALGHYNAQSEIGASILAHSSARHYSAHMPGAWALAGVARA
jgi:2-polyprenyl-6-methoxyphenol hydroxylase-like FAD-dependent oxidoreductase